MALLLQASLGGRGRSVVIVTGRTEAEHATETLQALHVFVSLILATLTGLGLLYLLCVCCVWLYLLLH